MEGYRNTIKTKDENHYEELMKRLNGRDDVWNVETVNVNGTVFVHYHSSLPEGKQGNKTKH